MIISIIAAMGENRVIGKNNSMMWNLPEEYQYFKNTTLGHHIINGRKNFEAIGRALPGRVNLVVTRNAEYVAKDCLLFSTIGEAIEFARVQNEKEVFICGGGQIYQETIELADRIYLTKVNFKENGDVYFPEFDEAKFSKKLVKSKNADDRNKYSWDAFLFERIK